MRSKWIEHNGTQIFYQNFSGVDILHSDQVVKELQEVQEVVTKQPLNSVLVLADFRNTAIGKELLQVMTKSSDKTKAYVRRTAVLGVVGSKRIFANMLMSLTGQDLMMFEEEENAKNWLIR
jgi:hypothetical protein